VGSSSSTYFHRQFPNHGVVATPTIEDDFLYLDQGKCDIALVSLDTWELYKGYAEYNGECNKEWIGRTVQYAESGFSLMDSITHCSSLLRDVFNLYMVEMKQDGTYKEIWRNYRQRKSSVTCGLEDTLDTEEKTKLTVRNIGGVFITHAVVLVLAVLVAVAQHYLKKQRKFQEAMKAEMESTCEDDEMDSLEARSQNTSETGVSSVRVGYDMFAVNPGHSVHPNDARHRFRQSGRDGIRQRHLAGRGSSRDFEHQDDLIATSEVLKRMDAVEKKLLDKLERFRVVGGPYKLKSRAAAAAGGSVQQDRLKRRAGGSVGDSIEEGRLESQPLEDQHEFAEDA